MREKIIQAIAERKLITIFRGIAPKEAVETARALLQGGLTLMEVTFDQQRPESFPATQETIALLLRTFGEDILVGAGTVTTPALVRLAREAGAAYIISPDCKAAVIEATRNEGLVSIPGVMTPTEIAAAHDYGADYVKLFPAGVLGAAYVKAVRAPLNHIPMLGVGGVSAENMRELRRAGLSGFGVGGNLVNKQWIREGRFAEITALAKQMAAIVAEED